MAGTAVAMVPRESEAGAPLRLLRRQRVRELVMPETQHRPARATLNQLVKTEQERLFVTRDQYAEFFGVSGATLTRFRMGGKLGKVLRRGMLVRHPNWQKVIDAVLVEDARREDAGAFG